MFRFIKKIFIGLLSVCTQVSFRGSITPKDPKKCLTLNSRPCQARPTLVNIDSDETLFYSFSVSVYKCYGICNTIEDPSIGSSLCSK